MMTFTKDLVPGDVIRTAGGTDRLVTEVVRWNHYFRITTVRLDEVYRPGFDYRAFADTRSYHPLDEWYRVAGGHLPENLLPRS